MSFADATELWGLNESTLRKAIAYGKLLNGIDVCKFGKQWVVSVEAMKREYGEAQEAKVLKLYGVQFMPLDSLNYRNNIVLPLCCFYKATNLIMIAWEYPNEMR